MTIVSVTLYLIPGDPRPSDWCARKPYVFVRVETDSGVVGWGEAYTFTHRETALLSLIHSLGARLVGKELSSIQAFRHDTVHGFGEQRIGIVPEGLNGR